MSAGLDCNLGWTPPCLWRTAPLRWHMRLAVLCKCWTFTFTFMFLLRFFVNWSPVVCTVHYSAVGRLNKAKCGDIFWLQILIVLHKGISRRGGKCKQVVGSDCRPRLRSEPNRSLFAAFAVHQRRLAERSKSPPRQLVLPAIMLCLFLLYFSFEPPPIQNGRLWLHTAVWLQARVSECRLGLQPRLNAALSETYSTAEVAYGIASSNVVSFFCTKNTPTLTPFPEPPFIQCTIPLSGK